MSRRLVSLCVLTVLLVSTFSTLQWAQKVEASGTIYIRSDGSIDPPTASILTVDNVTYTLTGNITSDTDGIIIERDNVVVYGAGYTIQGTKAMNSRGIDLTGRNNVTIKNMKIAAFECGIFLFSSSGNSIDENNLANNFEWDIVLGDDSSGNSVGGNNITGGGATGIYFHYSFDNRISGNNIIGFSHCGILLYSSSGNSISGNNITNNGEGIWLSGDVSGSSGNKFYHNNFINNTYDNVFQLWASVNVWDDDYPSGGNYWSDYVSADVKSGPNQDQLGSDGLCDTPYTIDVNNTDRYPLMYPWSPLPVHDINTGLGYATIQEALNAPETLDGHTIFVEDGAYYENVVVNKSLTLIGEDRETTIIDGNEAGDVVSLSANGVSIIGFTIRNGVDGIHATYSNGMNISTNIISDNQYDGVFLGDSNNSTIMDNYVGNNITSNVDTGIRLNACWNFTISKNSISENLNGIYLGYSSNITVSGNDIRDNNYGICLNQSSNHNTITENKIINNEEGIILLLSSSENDIVRNIIETNFWNGIILGGYYEPSNGNLISENSIRANGYGISLGSSNNDIVGNNIIENSGPGILLDGSSEGENSDNNLISGNNITGNGLCGVLGYDYYEPSNNNLISENNIWANSPDGISLHGFSNTVITGNNVTGNVNSRCLIGLAYSSDNEISGNNIAGNAQSLGINLYASSGHISGNSITGNFSEFIKLDSCSYSVVSGNSITANNTGNFGIRVYYSIGNWVSDNDVETNAGVGIYLSEASHNTVDWNNVTGNNQYGIALDLHSCNNTISGNIVATNDTGLLLWGESNNNIIFGNSITADNQGFVFYDSADNRLYHNNFVCEDFVSTYRANIWDDGYPSGGNYWSDYAGLDADGDGIGDSPYVMNEYNQDRYPLMEPYGVDFTPPLIGTPSREPAGDVQPDQPVKVSVNVTDIISEVKNATLLYSLDNGTSWEEPVIMNLSLISNLYEATIPGQPAGTLVKYKIVAYDYAGNNATLEGTEPYLIYQVIPEFLSLLILPLLMIAAPLAVIFYRRKSDPE